MAKNSQFVEVGGRKIELSNLTKVLFPQKKIVKAEVIQYYLSVAPTILTHLKGRALSLIRYPEGIEGERFFQKNRPDWTPAWFDHVLWGKEDKKEYLVATEIASLVWLSNLACLELHQMHSKKPHLEYPDYFVLDLDPPEGYDFKKVVQLALDLKDHLESLGYVPFAKTTGGKGIHIVVPIAPKWSFQEVFDAVSGLAKPFVSIHKETTLHIKKESRKGRILVDIYRNRRSQTIVAAYSLRGTENAPVAMPVYWDQLKNITSPQDFNISNVPAIIVSEGDAWEGISAYAVDLHTYRSPKSVDLPDPAPSLKYKSPHQLKIYQEKRNFNRSQEPTGEVALGEGNAFVIHRHHATRLHYDLRLEEKGVLRSWAVPKGIPPLPGIKRLAVQTEDHPLQYLNFEGEIPKGEYGAGKMWRFITGKYEITKKKKNGFYFQLHSPHLEAEFRIHQTKEKEWLLERVDQPQVNWLELPVDPMLAESRSNIPDASDHLFEVKWDGIRALIFLNEGELKIQSRNHKDISLHFPELLIPEKAFRANNGVFDAEIVCLDAEGRPDFQKVIRRLHTQGEASIHRLSRTSAAFCYVFDCLYLDGRVLIHDPLIRRKEWMADALKKNTPYRISTTEDDGEGLFNAARQLNLEGIMAKRKESKYYPGKRNSCWYKIKVRQTEECMIIGYTSGNAERKPYFGALHLAQQTDNGLIYKGKVGTGFGLNQMKDIFETLESKKTVRKPVKENPPDAAKSIWIAPGQLFCEIQFASLTSNNTYREPVFIRMSPDLT
ncbi:MAG: non-homologous end-joining DNA ligase [Candidatus Cyclobacteriaceae bacterium M3_2C_046]